MEYISTRNNLDSFSFKSVFLKGLADDGGLFVPKSVKSYSKEELKASGFLDKRAAISTITDKADEENLNIDQNQDTQENDNLDDFINHN